MTPKTRDPAKRSDLDHIIGVIAREMKQIKDSTGALPRYRCAGTRFSGGRLELRFGDLASLQFYKQTVLGDPGPPGSQGYFVRGADEPPPYRRFRSWVGSHTIHTVCSVYYI